MACDKGSTQRKSLANCSFLAQFILTGMWG